MAECCCTRFSEEKQCFTQFIRLYYKAGHVATNHFKIYLVIPISSNSERLKSLDFRWQDNDQPRTCGAAVHTTFTGQSLQFFSRTKVVLMGNIRENVNITG
ncbi:uncharacterized protein LOC144640494 [Oculina patagonica]